MEFQRLAPKSDETERGLGLGLAIVDRIAGMLDHPVAVRSQLGRGSCFSVTLPVAEVASTPLAPAVVLPRRRSGFGDALVLCIDNDAAILDGIVALLRGWDCRVIGARTAEEALARLEGQRPEVAIVDYHLDGGATGLTAIDGLCARFGEIAVAFLTADHSEPARELITGRGYPLLYKPVKPAALRALLGRLVQPAQQPVR